MRNLGTTRTNQSVDIRTDRLHLRLFTREDSDAYAAIMGDRDVGKWFPRGEGYTREEAEKSLNYILEHWNKHGFGIWAVTHKEDNAFLGRCGLNLVAATSETEVDFVIAKNYWGRGYATEAARAALAHGFQILNLERIIALAKPDNVASIRVIKKIGMRHNKTAEYWGITCELFDITKAEYMQTLETRHRE